jgi:two-component system LytT family response regulator
MNEIGAVIVDDEPLARQAMHILLQSLPSVKILAEFSNGIDAVKQIPILKPDVVFLDIQMPKLSGFDVIELLGEAAPLVVFVTAYDEYALKAFEAAAVDYLLKPVRLERLEQSLEKIRKLLHSAQKQSLQAMIHTHKIDQGPLKRIIIKDGMDVTVIPVNEVLYIEAADDFITIHTEKKNYLKFERMNALEQLLDPSLFCRIHRSYLLNITCLERIEPYSKDSKLAVLKNSRKIPISRSGYKQLLKLI